MVSRRCSACVQLCYNTCMILYRGSNAEIARPQLILADIDDYIARQCS